MGTGIVGMVAGGLARQGSRLTCWLPVGVALGIVGYFSFPAEPSWGFCLMMGILALVGVLLLVWSRRMVAVTEWVASWQILARCLGGVFLSVGLGFLLAYGQAIRQPPMPRLPMESVWLEGRLAVLEPLSGRREGQRPGWHIGVDSAVFDSPWYEGMLPLSRRVSVTFLPKKGQEESLTGLAIGQSVRLRALLRSPAPPLWPGGYDGQRAAWFSGRAGAGLALSFPQPVTLPQKRGFVARWGGELAHLRQRVGQLIEATLPGQEGAVAKAVLCGETGSLSAETRQSYAASGLAHLLAVAGLHLGCVMGLVFTVARRCMSLSQRLSSYWPCREVAMMVSFVAGAGYVALTGLHVPGVRALGMAGLAVLALLLGRRAVSMRGLALICLALEGTSPCLVLDVSFQMSFAAVMALVAGYEAWRGWLLWLGGHNGQKSPALWRRVAVLVATLGMTSLLAGLATLPLSMAYFGAFQPWFVIANLLAVPLMGVWVMPSGMVALLLMPLGLSSVPLRVMGRGIRFIGWLACRVASAPLASWPVPSFPVWSVVLFMLGLAVLCLWQGRCRLVGVGAMAAALVAVWLIDRPVMLLVEPGPVLAVRQAGEMRVLEGRPSSGLVVQEMQRAFGWRAQNIGMPDCTAGVCHLRLRGDRIILWRGVTGPDEVAEVSCKEVVLEVRLGEQHPLCPSVRQLGAADRRREGSWAVYDTGTDDVRLVSDRMAQGDRLWSDAERLQQVAPFPLAPAE
ncbi:ComEC/Rec2 family competence protein [Bombella intestini]|uniref:ComEC/Rec2 family competence protein n=1 Tax=Bombella intestini TaxID=1539051 RepID=UPI0009856832|nr:ComEC/Rec2 family competence protein [Bombella intestini]